MFIIYALLVVSTSFSVFDVNNSFGVSVISETKKGRQDAKGIGLSEVGLTEGVTPCKAYRNMVEV